jgi:alkyl hydroperoxide reductase subunit F
MAVPMVFLNGELFGAGRMTLEEIVGKIDTACGQARSREDRAPRPVRRADRRRRPGWCRGGDLRRAQGHPRGSWRPSVSAARCSTRWASRTSSRCKETEGPKFAAALEEHVRHYDVDIMNLQRADKLIPASERATA